MFLRKMEHRTDVKKLLPYLDSVNWDEHGRCSLNSPTGHWLYDPYVINDEWKNTEFEKVLSQIPEPIGEARLMKLEPGECYRSHADIDDRIHLNLTSNYECYLIDLYSQYLHKIKTDNIFYKMDGSYIHTAVNFGSSSRIQLVIRVPLIRNTDPSLKTIILEFQNPPYNLRYILDHDFSPWLNRAIKDRDIGYFNLINQTTYELTIKESVINRMSFILDNLKIKYSITFGN